MSRPIVRRRKPAPAIVRLYRLAAVRWLDFAYGRALAKAPRSEARVRRLGRRRTRARVALYSSRGVL